MTKIVALLSAIGWALLAFCGSAGAASFYTIGGTTIPLPGPAAPNNGFDPSNNGSVDLMGLGVGTPVVAYNSSTVQGSGDGLQVTADTRLLFTYVGKEAGYTNQANNSLTFNDNILFNTNLSGGQTASGSTTSPLVQFLFTSLSYGRDCGQRRSNRCRNGDRLLSCPWRHSIRLARR